MNTMKLKKVIELLQAIDNISGDAELIIRNEYNNRLLITAIAAEYITLDGHPNAIITAEATDNYPQKD